MKIVLIVKESESKGDISFRFLLLLEKGVESGDCCIFEASHRARLVEDVSDFCELIVHVNMDVMDGMVRGDVGASIAFII